MPYAQYVLSGTVTDGDSKPVQGIQVTFDDTVVTTDESGNWAIATNASFIREPYTLQVKDIDGETNGSFKDDQIGLNLVQTEPESGWYEGKFEQNDISIVLKPKE